MPQPMRIDAPAKINLYLKVAKRRPDAYHEIETLFERIDLVDKISIKKAPAGIEVSSNIPIVRRQEDNLAYRAASAILVFSGAACGVRIHIDKKIPIAAGLGGGSSDAASVLIGMNRLFRFGLRQAELELLGRRLGADVPFFLSRSRFALGTGRGDVIRPIESERRFWHLLVSPDFTLKTADVYEKLDAICSGRRPAGNLTKGGRKDKIKAVSIFCKGMSGPIEMLHNDLQDAAIELKKEAGDILKRLASSSGTEAVMSGSGPSVFCLFRQRKEAERAKENFLERSSAREMKSWRIFIVKTL